MKDVVLQRVIQVKDNFTKSKMAFSSKLDMPQTTVNEYLNGKRNISLELILRILVTFPEVSAEWLLRGEGDMLKADKTSNTYNIKGTDNSVNVSGKQNKVETGDKEIIAQLLQQNQQLIMMLAQKK